MEWAFEMIARQFQICTELCGQPIITYYQQLKIMIIPTAQKVLNPLKPCGTIWYQRA